VLTLEHELRICIVAESASFKFGGESSLPLHYFLRLRARRVKVWLIVHSRTRDELESLFPADREFILYISDRWYHRVIWRIGSLLPRRVAEATCGILMVLINQRIQVGMARKLIREHNVNVVHQPIPVSPKAPSFIYGLGVPVVIGPMNGGMEYPVSFRQEESLFTRATVALTRASANIVNAIIRGKVNASVLMVANERTRHALPRRAKGQVVHLPENGVDLSMWTPAAVGSADAEPARFIFVGRLVDWKRLDFVLQALQDVPDARLDVIGDGPMRSAWLDLAARLGISERVSWLGWLSQPECAKHLQGAAALVLPSIYECGGAVVLEAMACGIPVVATDWGGPSEYLDDTCGILIDPSSSKTIIEGFVQAQCRLIGDAELRVKLGKAGRRRVELNYDWSKKIDRILEIYVDCKKSSAPSAC